jgi:plastocyanin
VTVTAGESVTCVNQDDIPHAIAATGKEFRSKVLDTDDKFSFTFTTAGSFEYFCSLHPHMTGTIVVEAATGGPAAP